MSHRPVDIFLCVAFATFALTTFTVDLWAVTGWIHGTDPLADALRVYTEAADPLFGEMPPRVWVLMLLSLVFFGPMDVLVVLALLRQDRRIVVPGLVFAGAQITAMLVYFGLQWAGEPSPRSWAWVLLANGPYVVVPAILIARLASWSPFDSREARSPLLRVPRSALERSARGGS